MAAEGAHQRTGPAFGTQAGVDRPQRAFAGVVGADPHHRRRDSGGGTERGDLVGVTDRLGDEDDVDITHVVELAGAALAHPDNASAAEVGGLPDLAPGDGQRASIAPAARSASSAAASSTRMSRLRSRAASRKQQPAVDQPELVAVVGRAEGLRSDRPQSVAAGSASRRRARASRAGWLARWSPSATLAPSTRVSRSARSSSTVRSWRSSSASIAEGLEHAGPGCASQDPGLHCWRLARAVRGRRWRRRPSAAPSRRHR